PSGVLEARGRATTNQEHGAQGGHEGTPPETPHVAPDTVARSGRAGHEVPGDEQDYCQEQERLQHGGHAAFGEGTENPHGPPSGREGGATPRSKQGSPTRTTC